MGFKDPKTFGLEPEVESEYPNHALLEEQVAACLAEDGAVDAVDVNVVAQAGNRIALIGRVGSMEEAERAIALARQVPGVSEVESRLQIG